MAGPQDSALASADGRDRIFPPPAGSVGALAARPQGLDHTHRAIDGRTFLVGGEQKRDRAAMAVVLRNQAFDRCRERRKRAFHVGGPATMEHAVADRRRERITRPFFARPRRYDVRMARNTTSGAAVRATGPQVVDVAEAHRLDREARRGKPRADQRLTSRILGSDRRACNRARTQDPALGFAWPIVPMTTREV